MAKKTDSKETTTADSHIRLLSWNIDGLDKKDIRNRAFAVAGFIKQQKPDVVLLQEVVPDNQTIIGNMCRNYQLFPSNNKRYYNAIMVKKSTMVENVTVFPFPTSQMGRTLLTAKVEVKGVKLAIMNSHLESCKELTDERKNQLQQGFQRMQEADAEATVIFGGDLNLRDYEVTQLGGLPENIIDVWEEQGSRAHNQFTWDLKKNDNLTMPGWRQPRLRFDRIYVRHPKEGEHVLKPVSFELVGTERVSSIERFASDHFGIMTSYEKVEMIPSKSDGKKKSTTTSE